MKKEYKKPELLFNSFELSMSIAGGCGSPTQTPSESQCGIDFGGKVLFLEGISGCADKVEDGHNGLCYHVPNDTSKMFNS